MKSKAELKREYKNAPKNAGVFLITNTVNGKLLLGSSRNIHGPVNKHRFMLCTGAHLNAALQADWNKFGADAFKFEVVAVIEPKDDPAFSLELELCKLEQVWLAKTEPVGERGYNPNARIRE